MPPLGGTWLAYIAYIGPKDVTDWTAVTLDAHLKTINKGKKKKTLPHGHHIVMKGDKFDENKKAREILCKVGIDPYIGKENLVFSPNWCHSKVYAVAVLGALKLAKPGGKGAVATTLITMANSHRSCAFATQDGVAGANDEWIKS